ncbi:MAG: helix-turn-helix transcriptional regulator [Spirochaetes bacterium]|nr:helix-turn-helix transcriptional regulator [Spirochaetota bacterium]
MRKALVGPDNMGRPFGALAVRMTRLTLISCVEPYRYPEHLHRWGELILPRKGRYACTLNGEHLTVEAGQALFVQPPDRHADEYEVGSELLFLFYDFLGIDGEIWPHGILRPDRPMKSRILPIGTASPASALTELLLSMAPGRAYRPLATEKLGEAFFWELCGGVPRDALSPAFVAAMEADAFQRAVLDHFAAKIYGKLEVEAMAEALGMSKRNLEYRFRRAFGSSPMQAFTARKLGLASRLLESGESVQSVAEKLGYADPFNFSTTFKRVMGFPPSRTVRRK